MKPYYDDGQCVIWHGDCREILPSLPKVDLVLTDPPYGIGADNRKRIVSRTNAAKAKDYGESSWDKSTIPDELIRLVLNYGKHLIIWGGNYYTHLLSPGPCWLVWDKDNTGDFADCELAWTNLKKAVRKIKYRWNGMIQENMGRLKEARLHPTQKPLGVMLWCIKQTSPSPISSILDPFMGSGTTLRAAKDLGRKCAGIEIEERYCEIAAKRLEQTVLFTDIVSSKAPAPVQEHSETALFDPQ